MSWIWYSELYRSSYCLVFSAVSLLILAYKFLEADKVPEISPIKLACSALNLKSFWDSLKRVSFYSLISFSTSSIMFSDSLNSLTDILFPFSRSSWTFISLSSLFLVAIYFFLDASNLYIRSSRTLLMLETSILLFDSSVAKADSWFLRMATSPSRFFLSRSDLANASLILVRCLSYEATDSVSAKLLSYSLLSLS